MRDKWAEAIRVEIEALRLPVALADGPVLPSSADCACDAAAPSNNALQAFVNLACNSACADCSASAPRWASVTHKVLICVECAGVHRRGILCRLNSRPCAVCNLHRRNLGRHISFVQGLFNDAWSEENLAALTASPGNQLLNSQLLEYHVPPSDMKPNPNSDRERRERYITAKCATHAATQLHLSAAVRE